MSEHSFEENIKKLEEIVRRLERGEIALEDGLSAFEQGVALIKVCQKQLDKAANRVQVLTSDGSLQDLKTGDGEAG